MTKVGFYHLMRTPLEGALPKLLEKTLALGKRAVVVAGSRARVEALDTWLWVYDGPAWLPHGRDGDDHADAQPVWLAETDATPNGATFLFLVDGSQSQRIADFERCFDLFDGNDPAAVQAARERWTACKAAGHDLSYFQQTDRGGWEPKA